MTPRPRLRRAALATALLLALSGCAAHASASSPDATARPTSVVNCGRTLSFPHSPHRIVSLWPAITEMLLSLGAHDRVVGQAFTDQSEPLPGYAKAYNTIPVLSKDAVNEETLISAKPDLVVADGEYHFDGKELPTIAQLKTLGIQVYVISSFCHGSVTTGHVADAQTDLTALGTLLGAAPRADELVAKQKSDLAAVTNRVAHTSATPLAVIQFYDGALYADARGLYSDVVTTAGGKNVYDADLPTGAYYAQVSVEDFLTKNPATIVYLYNSESDRAAQLDSIRKLLPTVAAVQQNQLIALPSTSFIGSRAVDGTVALAKSLHG